MGQTALKHTILIVDDNPSNLGVITQCLEERGYKTLVATDGTIVLRRAQHVRPDLILLDIVMPETDGFEICRQLKADESTRDIPVIFMTALTETEDKVSGFRAGAVDYITKPIQQEEVIARVETHLRLRDLVHGMQQQAVELTQANTEIQLLNTRLNAENVQVRADLQESEQKYETLVEQITEGHFVLRDERIVFANQTFCDMHGYQLEDVAGQHFSLFVAPESRQHVEDAYRKSHQQQSHSQLLEYKRLTKSGQHCATEMVTKTILHEGTPIRIGTCRDIAERLEMERHMREAERMAYIGRITTSLSHELRNPLSAIKMNLQMLEELEPYVDEDARRSITISVREVMRLEGILNEFLDFARPIHLNLRACDVNQMLALCVELLRVKFEKRSISLSCSYAQDIRVVQADEEKLRQVIINLLLNALEASGPQGRVWVTSRYDGSTAPAAIKIIVEDEGEGLPAPSMSHIFDPFFTTKTKGTGLGLTNVKHIVDAHGGDIHAGNREAGGAIFLVTLPV